MSIYSINAVSAAIILIFSIPVLMGLFSVLTRESVRYSLISFFDYVELAAGIFVSFYVTRRIFFDQDGSLFTTVYNLIPERIKDLLYGKDILTYVIVVPLLLLPVRLILRALTAPVYRHFILPVSDRLYDGIKNMSPVFQRLTAAAWRLPKAAVITLISAFLLNFVMYYIDSPQLSAWTQSSGQYQFIYKNVLYPVLNSSLAKEIPVLVNDSFRRTAWNSGQQAAVPDAVDAFKKLTGGNIKIKEYFNGVTLDEAVKSNEQIDNTARTVVGKETDTRKKAYLIYKWISKNIEYDYAKVEKVYKEPENIRSGSIPAFETRKGICFDYSSLFVSMSRAVGLKVRLVTGSGYSGLSWGDHAWNQVYYPEENRWINVDATFGSTGANYFDKGDFSVDHKNSEVQGEW